MAYTYNDTTFESIDKSCPVAAQVQLGQIIDTIYSNLKSKTKYSGDLLTDAQVSSLDKMCGASDSTNIASIINSILDASKNEKTVNKISDTLISQINNDICPMFKNCALGTKIAEMIDIVNDMADQSEAEILTYVIGESEGTIDSENAAIGVEVPNGTDVTALIATFTLSEDASAKVGSTAQVSGTTANDFTNAVTYTITAEDGTTTKDWTVTVTVTE